MRRRRRRKRKEEEEEEEGGGGGGGGGKDYLDLFQVTEVNQSFNFSLHLLIDIGPRPWKTFIVDYRVW